MKKILSIALCVLMLVAALTACCKQKPQATFGSAVYLNSLAATDASADANGNGKVDITVAAVIVADGKIVDCDLDTLQIKVEYTAEGKAIANTEFKTKAEQGDAYNMVAYGGATQEWYKQADAFESFVAGKTVDEVKALVAEGNKGNADVIAAGCTIMINEFVGAIEKAAQRANESDVTAEHTLKVTAFTEQTCTDATADKNGSNKVATTFFAAAVDAEGKVVKAYTDCVEVSFGFDTTGKIVDLPQNVQSKYEQGSNYGMTAIGKQEWYIQAEAFSTACVGKTGTEIAGLMAEDGHGVESLQTAGCTIYVTGFVKAASKI